MSGLVQPPQPFAQLDADAGVKGTERLVEEQDHGPWGQRARQADPLALAAGELRRVALAIILELD